MIPNCVPCLEGNERKYVLEAVEANDLAIGPFLERFERTIAEYTGAAHAVALGSGTAALHLALLVHGVEPDDEVLVPALTFAATANAVRHCGAWPVFTDCDASHWGMDPVQVSRFLEEGCEAREGQTFDRRTGRRVRALVPVHLYGHPADMDALTDLAERHGLKLVEDGAEALGARHRGRAVGSLHGTCILSFNGNKVITTAGGGMVLARNEKIARRCRYLANQAKDDRLEYVHGAIGFNYRMSNLAAAVGLAQAERLEELVARKRRLAARYGDALADVPGVRMRQSAPEVESSEWMPILLLDPEIHPEGAAPRIRELVERGVGARPLWQPLDGQTPFADCPSLGSERSRALYASGLCLPCSCGILDQEVETVVAALGEVLTRR
jgi:perosamine synthetase